MDIKQADADSIMFNTSPKKDAIDTPDCYGEYNRENRLCSKYCSISIKCCVLQNKHPKIDILEKLLIHNHYAVKLH